MVYGLYTRHILLANIHLNLVLHRSKDSRKKDKAESKWVSPKLSQLKLSQRLVSKTFFNNLLIFASSHTAASALRRDTEVAQPPEQQ